MFSFFIILNIRNRKNMFSYPESSKIYSITFLIPAHNEEDSIEETVNHVVNLDYPKEKLEIIIINDGSTDKTAGIIKKLLKKYKNLKFLNNEENIGKAESLNRGIKIAKGELVAVTDSDSFPSEDSLKKMTGFFEDSEMGAVTSFVTVRNQEKNYLTRTQAIEYIILGWTRKLFDFINSVFVTNGPLSIYRKEYLLKVGGFDKNTVTEDIDITWNLLSNGYKTAMCLDARVSTVVPEKMKKYYNQRVRWGLGGLQVISKYKKTFFKKGVFGMFVLPFVSFSIFMSFFVLCFSTYLTIKSLTENLLITTYSTYSGASIFHFENINFYPSILLFYILVLFISSIIYYKYILSRIKNKENNIKNFFNLLFYILVYLSIYMFIWIPSIYRYLKKDNRW
jgi:biofilm PGA synthesis N-glycosyltransferase PgaC